MKPEEILTKRAEARAKRRAEEVVAPLKAKLEAFEKAVGRPAEDVLIRRRVIFRDGQELLIGRLTVGDLLAAVYEVLQATAATELVSVETRRILDKIENDLDAEQRATEQAAEQNTNPGKK